MGGVSPGLIRFTRERSRPQGLKNVHNFLMTVREMSWVCDIVAKMLLIKKKLFPLDMTVPRFCMEPICGWHLFQPPRLGWSYPLLGSYCYSGDYPTRGYRSCVKSQGVSALHCIANPKCTTVWRYFFYGQIHIKFNNQGEWISRIPQSILNQFSWHFAQIIV